MTAPRMVVLGVVGAPHGVRGEIRVKAATADPRSLGAYGPVSLPDGRSFRVLSLRPAGEIVIVRLEGVTDRDAAAALKGLTLSVPRERLPPPDDADDFYHADLIGLACETADGTLVGHVKAIHDFGAGDILDIRRPGKPDLTLGFTKANVPVVDIAGGRLVVVLPAEVEARGE